MSENKITKIVVELDPFDVIFSLQGSDKEWSSREFAYLTPTGKLLRDIEDNLFDILRHKNLV